MFILFPPSYTPSHLVSIMYQKLYSSISVHLCTISVERFLHIHCIAFIISLNTIPKYHRHKMFSENIQKFFQYCSNAMTAQIFTLLRSTTLYLILPILNMFQYTPFGWQDMFLASVYFQWNPYFYSPSYDYVYSALLNFT